MIDLDNQTFKTGTAHSGILIAFSEITPLKIKGFLKSRVEASSSCSTGVRRLEPLKVNNQDTVSPKHDIYENANIFCTQIEHRND